MIIAQEDPGAIQILKALCRSIPGLNPPRVARSKAMLLARINHGSTDLVFLDIASGMGGVSMIETIRRAGPDHHVIVTVPKAGRHADILVSALEAGAYECIEIPCHIDERTYQELRLHLVTVAGLLRSRKRFAPAPESVHHNRFFMAAMPDAPVQASSGPSTVPRQKIDIIAIAASTGGPEILSRIFSILPKSLKVPILLVQHIPQSMTRYFAQSLNEQSELQIAQAEHGQLLSPGSVYVAPGGQHMTVSIPDAQGRRQILLNDGPLVKGVRPSADVLFSSLAKSYRGNMLAVVLTGMGNDGRNGVAQMKQSGCVCITQNAETCVVYGMPKAVDEAGLSDERLDPLDITQKIVQLAQ